MEQESSEQVMMIDNDGNHNKKKKQGRGLKAFVLVCTTLGYSLVLSLPCAMAFLMISYIPLTDWNAINNEGYPKIDFGMYWAFVSKPVQQFYKHTVKFS